VSAATYCAVVEERVLRWLPWPRRTRILLVRAHTIDGAMARLRAAHGDAAIITIVNLTPLEVQP